MRERPCTVQPLSRRLRCDSSPSRGAFGKRLIFRYFRWRSKNSICRKVKMLTSAGQIVAKRLHSKTRRNAKASPTRGGGIKRSEDDGEVVWKDGLPIESGVFWLRHNLHPAAPAPLLMHDHLPVDAVLQGGDMGDDAHQSVAFGQAGKNPDGLLQRFLIQ